MNGLVATGITRQPMLQPTALALRPGEVLGLIGRASCRERV